MTELAVQFWQQLLATQMLEWVAAIFGLVSVLFAQRNHILLYPAGLVSTAIYAYLWSRAQAGLYAEALLNVYYFVMTLYGWWHWQRAKFNTALALPISICTQRDAAIVSAIVFGFWLVFYLLLLQTSSTVPVWDSFVSATACAGMWLLARRKVENWLLLNLSNLIAIPLFLYKGYYVTAILTLLLFVVAIFGYLHWRALYASSKAEDKIKADGVLRHAQDKLPE
ncbi:MAG: nicotinamide mononucleotide transporter [Chitinophagaceae bacterium]|nr:nicotinamide mononucleotide transporter [Chitinophagaceae bacterium]